MNDIVIEQRTLHPEICEVLVQLLKSGMPPRQARGREERALGPSSGSRKLLQRHRVASRCFLFQKREKSHFDLYVYCRAIHCLSQALTASALMKFWRMAQVQGHVRIGPMKLKPENADKFSDA